MKKNYIKIIFLVIILNSALLTEDNWSINKKKIEKKQNINLEKINEEYIKGLYKELKISSFLDFEVFYNAIIGLEKINEAKKNIITIIDFSKSSLDKRFFVIDLKNKKTLYSTYVMHGKNSGDEFTTSFSNRINPFQSSPGFFMTENSYYGAYGYSLRLKGL